MENYHTVEQGEHIAGLAWSYGFSDYRTVWNHPNNADLKSERKNPNVLFPGDQVFIPDLRQGEVSKPTDQRHKFTLDAQPLRLRVTLEDQYEKPIAGAACVLSVGADTKQLTSDGEGKVELVIPPSAKESVLIIQDGRQTPYGNIQIPIKIGSLDPVKEVSGQQARLKALGYFTLRIDGQTGADFRSAVEEFQCEHSLFVDGDCGPATQAKLVLVYGC